MCIFKQYNQGFSIGQVEIFNKQFKTHTTKQFHDENETELRQHAQAFILFYNHQKPLKFYRLKTPECFLFNRLGFILRELYQVQHAQLIFGIQRFG